jgi:hypothetical protein
MHLLLAAALLSAAWQSDQLDASALFERGRTMDQFLETVTRQRELWVSNSTTAKVLPVMRDRFKRAGADLPLLIVAEDWCPDSVHTVPYVAALAAQASVDLRIVDRPSGAPVMKRYPAPDGRGVTPVIVLRRRGVVAGAWIERPAVLHSLFESIKSQPENAGRFAERQAWYKADGGRTAIAEIVALAEQSAGAKSR